MPTPSSSRGRRAGDGAASVVEAVTRAPAYLLHLDLGPVPASVDEVLREAGDRLDGFAPRLSRRRADLQLSLTVRAGDLWQAVLLAMVAVQGLGYAVVRLEARPVDRPGVGLP